MLSLRAHLIISGAIFAALILFVAGGGALSAAGVIKASETPNPFLLAILLALVVAFAMSLVPVMVKLVLGPRTAVGDQDVPAVKAALRTEKLIVWIMWLLMGGGMLIAIPAAIADGAFGPEANSTATPPP